MKRRFHKMHGLGNDFVVIDARDEPVALDPLLVQRLANRHFGIGCDQLILLEPSAMADLKMRIFNLDGSEVSACGNAARCVTRLEGGNPSIETVGGVVRGESHDSGATVDMGEPRFAWDEIPLAYPMDTREMPVGWDNLERPFAVNVGNPHVVFFVDLPIGGSHRVGPSIKFASLGAKIVDDPLFPEQINVNVARLEENGIQLRVWERGAGMTMACGTGACATAVAAISLGHVRSPVDVHQLGGTLTIAWEPGTPIRMTGPATHVFTGEIDLEAFA